MNEMNDVCVAANALSGGRCGILAGVCCDGKNEYCKFCMTREQQKAARNAAFQRIAKLSEDEQEAISQAYYGGEKPWLFLAKKNPWEDDYVRFSRAAY